MSKSIPNMSQPARLTTTPTSLFPARCAVSTLFFINGLVLASWVPHIPAVKSQHAISDGQLGIVLLAMAVGSVFALPLAGWMINRYGSRRNGQTFGSSPAEPEAYLLLIIVIQ